MAKTASKGKKLPVKKVVAKSAKKPAVAKPEKKVATPKVSANATSFEIRKGLTKPAPLRRSRELTYPYASLDVGDSFFVSAEIDSALYASEDEASKAQREEVARVANRMSGANRRYTKRNDGVKLSIVTESNGVSVWRDK